MHGSGDEGRQASPLRSLLGLGVKTELARFMSISPTKSFARGYKKVCRAELDVMMHTWEAEARRSSMLNDFLTFSETSRPATGYLTRPCLKNKTR